MRYWIITDTHFSHKRLIDWGRPEDFEAQILKNLKTLVDSGYKEQQIVIHLGDISIGDDAENMRKFVEATPNCKRILVKGNHDHRSDAWYMRNGFDFVCESMVLKAYGKKLLLTHIPVLKTDKFDMNIHGHLHGNNHRDPEKTAALYDRDWHYDCAPDIHDYKPLLLERIACK